MKGKGVKIMRFGLAGTTYGCHVQEFPAGSRSTFHRHGPGAIVCVTQGEGFAMVWRDGDERTRFEIKPGSIYSPGDLMYHGHFNTGHGVLRHFAMRGRSPKFSQDRLPHQAARDDSIRRGAAGYSSDVFGRVEAQRREERDLGGRRNRSLVPRFESLRCQGVGENTESMGELAYHDFRSFVEEAKKISDYRIIEGADWDAEIGALVESTAELVPQPPMLIFDKVKGYPAGYRVCSLPYAAYRRVALALGLPTDKPKLEILRLAARKVRSAEPIAPKEISTSPLFENKLTGSDVNLLKFPALRFHENDGGRYFGPGGGLINRDPESGYINSGTYRMQLHDKHTLGLWMSPGQNGRQICMKYWEQGQELSGGRELSASIRWSSCRRIRNSRSAVPRWKSPAA